MNKLITGGNCFEVAANNAIDMPHFVVCHALVAGQKSLEGRRISHAWNEVGDVVFDFSNGKSIMIRKEEYYRIAKITDDVVARYSAEEAARMMIDSGHYGPWGTLKVMVSEEKCKN